MRKEHERIEKAFNQLFPNVERKGNFYQWQINPDHNDSLCLQTLIEISENDDPEDCFYDQFDVTDSEWYEGDYIKREICQILDEDMDEEIIYDWIRDNVEMCLPYDHYLRQSVLVNIVLETGDWNYDYTLNNFAQDIIWEGNKGYLDIHPESSLLYLAKLQGYNKRQVKNAMLKRDFAGSQFLFSMYSEVLNSTSHMNAVTFFTRLSLGEFIFIKKEKPSLMITPGISCGLLDRWQGAGSLLGLELEKEISLKPTEYDIMIDGSFGYGVGEIYGMGSKFWQSGHFQYSA